MLSASPTSQSAESSGFPGSTVAISSNGTTNGIVWAVAIRRLQLKRPRHSPRVQRHQRFESLVGLESDWIRQHARPRREICRPGRHQRKGLRWSAIRSGRLRHHQSGQPGRRAVHLTLQQAPTPAASPWRSPAPPPAQRFTTRPTAPRLPARPTCTAPQFRCTLPPPCAPSP